MNKKLLFRITLFLTLLLFVSGASATEMTDALGRVITIDSPQSVAALYGSYGDAWLNAGGMLSGVLDDSADDERLNPATARLGSVHAPNMELLFALEPDLVLLSADISQHIGIGDVLDSAGVPHAFLSVDDWRDYMEMIRLFTEITGRSDLLDVQTAAVQEPIESIIARTQAFTEENPVTCLLLRANSTSVKAKGSDDTIAGGILSDIGLINIADGESPLSENLSLEAILTADPDYVFIVYQGSDSDAAARAVTENLTSNPAWGTLSAVREGRVHVLDRELFHYHPNARWAEAYSVIEEMIIPADSANGR